MVVASVAMVTYHGQSIVGHSVDIDETLKFGHELVVLGLESFVVLFQSDYLGRILHTASKWSMVSGQECSE